MAGGYLADNFKDKKFAVIDDKSAYGKRDADEIAKAIQAKQVKVVLRESITAGEGITFRSGPASSSRRG